MRLTTDQCWSALRSAEHAILCTHGDGGAIDAVPVCFTVVSRLVVTPVDLVKEKRSTELGRLKNLRRDAAATLLGERWSLRDWSQLWWVRAHLVHRAGHDADHALLHECRRSLRAKYVQYQDAEFAQLLLFDVSTLTGWAASVDDAGLRAT